MSPDAAVADLEPWIATRLHPLQAYDPASRTLRSDYDLNPDMARLQRTGGLAAAAVLVPLVERPQGLSVLLTRRSDTLRNHSGQVAFPGGRCDPGETPWGTALREAQEEVGLDPAFVRLAGLGDPYETVTRYVVTPVVGFVRPGFVVSPAEAEVAEVFEVPFAWLMDAANHELREGVAPDGTPRRYYVMPHDGRMIWGATAGMLRALHDRLFG